MSQKAYNPSQGRSKNLYYFLPKQVDGSASLKNLLGNKGAHLAEMSRLGFPIPPGFTISASMCQAFYDNNKELPLFLKQEIRSAIERLGQEMGANFGDPQNPLLVSVRSGACVSMPGMMDSILNLGLNDQVVQTLARQSKDERFAWDCYRRFVQMYADVALSVDSSLLGFFIEDLKRLKNYKKDSDLQVEDLKKLVQLFKEQVLSATGKHFPQDPEEQLFSAISAVFNSWNNARAVSYRELNHYSHDLGTAVNVQAMVFGNKGEDSATGVAFTRDPLSGEKHIIGEFLANAQGEDVVAGVRTPCPIRRNKANGYGGPSLEDSWPVVFKDLHSICQKLETHFKDVQDIEFTVEKNRLWILQTRSAKRTAKASLKVALDMLDEGLIDEKSALFRIKPSSLEQLLHPSLDPKAKKTRIARGLSASPGGVSGKIVFCPEEAFQYRSSGEKVILVRTETSPEDIKGMVSAEGILTTRGGITSHAAVVARGMGKCCVVGCEEIHLDEKAEKMTVRSYSLKKGDIISIDGRTGEVFLGAVPTLEPQLDKNFQRFMSLVDKYARIKVRANADHVREAQLARRFGAQGIGLCRTEHMFFGEDRIISVRKMILAQKESERELALKELLRLQKQDFVSLFSVMQGLPVTIRLLDPPLHEFLPQKEKEIEEFAQRTGKKPVDIKELVESMRESNPMLGHRGCRLAVSFPQIYQMQAKAIALAVCESMDQGLSPKLEIMIPLVIMDKELKFIRNLVEEEIKKVQSELKKTFSYSLGAMIELPKSALTADELAQFADFFSFGTNDLTQTTLGLSRDDCGRFLPAYVNEEILTEDPFATVDQKGVGVLIQKAVELARKAKPGIKMGVCGEHGADEKSIQFFDRLQLDYVSCSAYRVPVARLISARSALQCASSDSK